MAKQKNRDVEKQDLEIELESLIEQNENLSTGMKKIINSIKNEKFTNKKN